MHPNTQRVTEALRAAGAGGQIRDLPDSASTAALAAAQLGTEVGAIANSLLFAADGEPLLVMTSGAHRVDTALEHHPVIWAAGGTPHTVFPTTYAELVRITGGTPAAVA